MITARQCFVRQLHREFLTQIRQPRLLVNAILFFIMVIVFFPLTIPANNSLLQYFAPGLIWMAVLLAILLASERLFQQDYDDGIIEQWLVSAPSLNLVISAKILAQWVMTIIPLILFCPLFAILFHFNWQTTLVLIAALLLGTPALFSLCALAAAFGTGVQQRGVFMALILLPLSLPVLIFGSGVISIQLQGGIVSGYLCLLAAFSLIATAFLPFAITGIIRIGLAD
ncbi:heme exporter protein CcmB [Legionella dresdenensis]|uniref:Heme exporter protein B n=1 Tax=Legionella dresdenensis TaxID=450200 RepID=A0ABV8CBP6_9GAMM